MPVFYDVGKNLEIGEIDLCRDYKNAVDCLLQCDTLFKAFQEQIQSKDDRIATLEDKVMELSLELASIKAGQDQLKLKKSSDVTDVPSTPPTIQCTTGRRMSWTSLTSESSNNSKFSNLGLLFMNKSLAWLEPKLANDRVQVQHLPRTEEEMDKISDGNVKAKDPRRQSSGSLNLVQRPLRSSMNSASSLHDVEGVIFPVSSFEVYSKGCSMERIKNDTAKNAEWPTLG